MAAAQAALYPVQTPVRGYWTAHFVADGGNVNRGQLVAKLAGANGRVAYVNAPATGRIHLVLPAGSGALVSHPVLVAIQIAPTPLVSARGCEPVSALFAGALSNS